MDDDDVAHDYQQLTRVHVPKCLCARVDPVFVTSDVMPRWNRRWKSPTHEHIAQGGYSLPSGSNIQSPLLG